MTGRPQRRHQARAVLATAKPAGPVKEAAWQRRVEGLLGYYGWTFFHDQDSRRNRRGFPDIAAHRLTDLQELHPDPITVPTAEVLFAELKAAGTKYGRRGADRNQAQWIRALALAGVEAYVWTLPDDYDAMHARLARGQHRIEPDWAVGLLPDGLQLGLDAQAVDDDRGEQ